MSLGNWTSREISQGKLPVLGGGQRRIYRCGVRMSMGVPVHCLVTHATPALYPVSVRRFRRPVMGFLQIRPRGRHPCLDGRFRSLRPVEDFHLLNWQHAWRTKKGKPRGFPFPDLRPNDRIYQFPAGLAPASGCSDLILPNPTMVPVMTIFASAALRSTWGTPPEYEQVPPQPNSNLPDAIFLSARYAANSGCRWAPNNR